MAIGRMPKYLEVANAINSQIKAGELTPGDRIPAETELAVQHKTTVPTVRQGLAKLREAGLIESFHGRGTFVRDFAVKVTDEVEIDDHESDEKKPEGQRLWTRKDFPSHLQPLVHKRAEATYLASRDITGGVYNKWFFSARAGRNPSEDRYDLARRASVAEAEVLRVLEGDPVWVTVLVQVNAEGELVQLREIVRSGNKLYKDPTFNRTR